MWCRRGGGGDFSVITLILYICKCFENKLICFTVLMYETKARQKFLMGSSSINVLFSFSLNVN